MAKPLLDVLRDVSLDPVERAAFAASPGDYLGQHGYDDVSPEDLSDAFGLVHDTLPAGTVQTLLDDPDYQALTGEAAPAVGLVLPTEAGDAAPFGDGDFDGVALRAADDLDADLPGRDDDADDNDLDADGLDGDVLGDHDHDTHEADDIGDFDDVDADLGGLPGRDGGDLGRDDVQLGDGFDADIDSVAFGTGSSEMGEDHAAGELSLDDGPDQPGLDDLNSDGPIFGSGASVLDVLAGGDDLTGDSLDVGAFGHGIHPGDIHDAHAVPDVDDHGPDEADGVDDVGLF